MKCHIIGHFIRVFTVCQSTHLGLASIHKRCASIQNIIDTHFVNSNAIGYTVSKLTNYSFYKCSDKVLIIGATSYTVKPVLSRHSKINKTKVFKTNSSLMKVESIAECSLGAFCNTFDWHLAIMGLENQF